jgi:hypothetical protein
MSTQIQRRRGTTAQHASFTGAIGETTIDTDKEVVVVHDGTQVGGYPLMRENASNSALALGSAATPSLKFTGDTNTGIYSPGADQVAISTNGTGRLFVDASGNVGVNTSSNLLSNATRTTLSLNNTGSAALALGVGGTRYAHFYADATSTEISATSNYLYFTAGGSERLRITAAGLVGLGTSAPDGRITVQRPTNNQGISGGISFKGQDGTTQGGIGTDGVSTNNLQILAAQGIYFHTGNTDGTTNIRATLDSSGRLGIGTSSPGNLLHVESSFSGTLVKIKNNAGNTSADTALEIESSTTAAKTFLVKNSGTERFYVKGDGTSYFNGSVGIGTTSPSQQAATGTVLQVSGGENGSEPALVLGNYNTNTAGNRGRLDFVGVSSLGNPKIVGSIIGKIESTGANTANGAIAFETLNGVGPGGTERARIDSSGRLLVGTSTSVTGANQPQYAKLQVIGNTLSGARAGLIALGRSAAASTIVAGDGLGGITFGDNAAGEFAYIFGEADGTAGTNDYPGRLVFSTTADGAASPTERMRIRNNGDIYYGTTGQPFFYFMDTDGSSPDGTGKNGVSISNGEIGPAIRCYASANSWNHVGFYNNTTTGGTQVGTITTSTSATAYNTSSDYRLKENFVPLTGAADRLSQLQVHRFNFIADPDHTVDGFIAHEAQAVVPECVTGEKDAVDDDGNPIYQGIDQSKLVPLLTAALQEAIGRIETLEAEVAALKGA